MRFVTILLAAALSLWSAVAHAQTPAGTPPLPTSPSPVEPLFALGAAEWMVTAGPAFGVEVFHSAEGHNYVLNAVSWGRVLTGPVGPGALRGRFQWSLEVIPVFGQYDPVKTLGIGVTPLAWRWNFEPRGRLAPFAELAGGALWTREPVPTGTTTANFTAHAGFGIRYFVRDAQALVLGYRFHHISNGNRLERNPGVNAHVLQAGWSVMRPR